MAQRYVRMLEGFGDGDTFTIPSIGQAQVDDYVEDQAVVYRPMDTGEFQFQITEYLSSATYITKKAKQDSFYMSELTSRFVPEQERAIMAHFENTTFATPEAGVVANSNEVSMVLSTVGLVAAAAQSSQLKTSHVHVLL